MEFDARPMDLAGLGWVLQNGNEQIADSLELYFTRRPGRGLVMRASIPPRLNISIHNRTIRSVRQNCWQTVARLMPMSKERTGQHSPPSDAEDFG